MVYTSVNYKRYYQNNKDTVNARSLDWKRSNPEKVSITARNSYLKRKDRGYKDNWQKDNKDRVNELARIRYHNNQADARESAGMRSRGREAKKRGVFVEWINRKKVYNLWKGDCAICLKAVDPNNFHVDHRIPLSRQGLHCYLNVQLTHPECNWAKCAKPMGSANG